jgi:3-mercaptopyruvate sulfurtransferase SseA
MTPNENRKTILPLFLLGLGAVFVVASLLWYLNSAKGTKIGQGESAGPTSTEEIPYPEIKRIQVEDAKAAFELKQAVFIDTRGEPGYSEGHIPGALVITQDEILNRINELDPEAWFITYCT